MGARSVSLLLSGGIDSTALVPFYLARGDELRAIHFDYGQPSAQAERRAARAVCKYYGLQVTIQELGFPLPCVTGEYRARNALLLLSAAALDAGASAIAIGIHDGTPYYDCSEAFVQDTNRVLEGYFGGAVFVEAPFLEFDKRRVCEFALHAEVPLGLTFSCERASGTPCGECASCQDRRIYLERS